MRSFSGVGLLALCLSGCSAPPTYEEVAALADEDQRLVWADHAHTPNRLPDPAAPRMETPKPRRSAADLVRPSVSASFEELDDGSRAVQKLSAAAMPAIDVDTGIVVVPRLEILQLSTRVGWFEVVWIEPDGLEESIALVGDARGVRRSVREVNAKLRESKWRAMKPLAVELPSSESLHLDLDEPPGERRVQAIVQHGELIVRIHGVKVLERHPADIDRRMSLHRIYADSDSGTALAIFMKCTGEDCTCDPVFTAQIMRFEQPTFAAIDRRPCGLCEPTDFGFNDGAPWD
jgi:hypothetical protein